MFSEMGPAPSALAQLVLPFVAEGIRKAAFALAFHALNLDVGYLTRSPEFTKVKLVAAIALASVDELDPGEIIQVTVLARHEETGRHDGRSLALPLTDPMHIPAAVPPVKIELQLEES